MPTASDLIPFLSANHPEDDASTTGGARSAVERPLDSQFSATAAAALVSTNAADTMNVTVRGRDAAGEIVSEVIALNGTTEVVTTQTYERILTVVLAAGPAGTVTLRQGAAGTARHTFAPAETGARIFFIGAVADAVAAESRYEKYFWENAHATESLLGAQLQLSADPQANYQVGVAATIDDTVTVANRLAAPAGITFVDDAVDQAVPGTDLAALTAVGHWVRQDLTAAEAAGKDTFTTQLSGSSA